MLTSMLRSAQTCHLRTICKGHSWADRAARARGSRALASAQMLTHSTTLANSPQLAKLLISWKQNCTKKHMLRMSFASPGWPVKGSLVGLPERERDRPRDMIPRLILPTLPNSLKPKGLYYQTSSHPTPLLNYVTGKKKKNTKWSNMAVSFVAESYSGSCKVFSKLSSSLYFPCFLLSFFSFHYLLPPV